MDALTITLTGPFSKASYFEFPAYGFDALSLFLTVMNCCLHFITLSTFYLHLYMCMCRHCIGFSIFIRICVVPVLFSVFGYFVSDVR